MQVEGFPSNEGKVDQEATETHHYLIKSWEANGNRQQWASPHALRDPTSQIGGISLEKRGNHEEKQNLAAIKNVVGVPSSKSTLVQIGIKRRLFSH